ncbi:unnamed protein product, partial [Brassica rapa subsp. trilocularis]
ILPCTTVILDVQNLRNESTQMGSTASPNRELTYTMQRVKPEISPIRELLTTIHLTSVAVSIYLIATASCTAPIVVVPPTSLFVDVHPTLFLGARSSLCKKNHRIYSARAWLTRSARFCVSEASTSSLYAASDTFTGEQTPFGCAPHPCSPPLCIHAVPTQPPSPPSSSPFAVLVTDPSLSSTQLMGCVLSYQAWQIMMTSGLGCFQSSL